MKTIRLIIVFVALIALFHSCKKDKKEIDKEKPTIDLAIPDAFPVNCDTLYFGEAFQLKALFSDNAGLGSYSIDIHHNFDHHSHSTEVTECNTDPVKAPVNPFTFIRDYAIPANLKEYTTNLSISIPSGNNSGL